MVELITFLQERDDEEKRQKEEGKKFNSGPSAACFKKPEYQPAYIYIYMNNSTSMPICLSF